MRIKVVSTNPARYEAIRRALIGSENATDISGGVGSTENLNAFINGVVPDVLIVDGASAKTLDSIESLSQRRPTVNAIVIAQDTSADFLLRAIRVGVREVVPAPGTTDALNAALDRIARRSRIEKPTGDGKVIAVLSCKGGSGATFIAANLAHAFAAAPTRRVALIDLNLQFGDAALFLSALHAPSSVAELAQQIARLDASLLNSAMLHVQTNLGVLAAPDDPAHATDIKREHVEAIINVARNHHDVVILDVSRSLDVISLQALDMADAIVPVTQLTLPFIRDANRLLKIFRSLDYPKSKVHVIVNRYEKGGEITLDDLERTIGTKVFMTIPNSYAAVASSVNLGVPIAKLDNGNPVSRALADLAEALHPAPQPAAVAGGWLSRILGRD